MLIQSSSHLSLEQNALIVGDSISQLYDFKSMEPTGYMLTLAFFVVQLLSCAQMFATPRTAASQSSLSFTIPQSLLKLMSIELVMPFNHLFVPFSCPQSFSASGSFQMSQLFASGAHSIGVSASTSVLPMNTQD